MKRDVVWTAVDVVAAVGLLVSSLIVQSVWLWLVGFAWAALAARQAQLATRARRGADQ